MKNLGVYLKNTVDGFEDCIDKEANHGMVKFGTSSRTFCQSVCNFLTKGELGVTTLYKKMDTINSSDSKYYGFKAWDFPYMKMDFIRTKTNIIVYGVAYNEDATKQYMSVKDQQNLLVKISEIAAWLEPIIERYEEI